MPAICFLFLHLFLLRKPCYETIMFVLQEAAKTTNRLPPTLAILKLKKSCFHK